MTELVMAVQVPISDSTDLSEFSAFQVGSIVEKRGLDGASVAEIIVVATGGSLGLLRSWLLARIDHRKSTTVSWNGRNLTGYSASDVERIVSALERDIKSESTDEQPR
jgi:hypothetical protein